MPLQTMISLGISCHFRPFLKPTVFFPRPARPFLPRPFTAFSSTFHTTPRLFQQTSQSASQAKDSSPKPFNINQARNDFNSLTIDEKLRQIAAIKAQLKLEKQDSESPHVFEERQAVEQRLDELEKTIRASDRWWKKAFRTIAWGPTIVVNAIVILLSS